MPGIGKGGGREAGVAVKGKKRNLSGDELLIILTVEIITRTHTCDKIKYN